MRWTDLLRPDLAPEAVLALAALGLALVDALVRPRRAGRAPEYLTLAALAAALSLSLLPGIRTRSPATAGSTRTSGPPWPTC